MNIYNSLTRKTEAFAPINPPYVGMYTCGPTVYSYPTIGNYRTYVTADLLLRSLKFIGYKPKYVVNLTDVGHLTGDNLGDADTGEDRLEKASKKEGKNAWDIAKFYSKDFVDSFTKLNITPPDVLASATAHIDDQIKLIEVLEEKGLTYKIDDGIYFDTVTFETKTGQKYGELSTLDQIQEGARVEPNPQKKDPHDFALWKFSPKNEKRDMEWPSKWGTGFPGWHLECSAMSMKYLGDQFDIHVGGEDLRSTHHPNEIAQSEGATGKFPFVKYWIHGAFLLVDGGRMGKSLGNAYTLYDLEKRGFDSLDLRYFYLTAHYRKQMNFTFKALEAAQKARQKLVFQMQSLRSQEERSSLSEEKEQKINDFRKDFTNALEDDLNFPEALAVVWSMFKSNIPASDKYDLAISFDEVLGLGLTQPSVTKKLKVAPEIEKLLVKRQELRQKGEYEKADKIRDTLTKMGYHPIDDKL